MGIGVALANGLVRGFTQNIEREMAKRASEREKLDLYTQTVLEASTKKNFSNENVKAISGMIQNARNTLNEREAIDLFGTASAPLDVDFTGLLADLKATTDEDEETTVLGKLTLPFKSDFTDENFLLVAPNQVESYLTSNADEVEKALKDEDTKREFGSYIKKVFDTHNVAFWRKNSGRGDDGMVSSPAYADYGKTAPTLRGYLQEYGVIGKSKFITVPEELPEGETTAPVNEIEGGSQNMNFRLDAFENRYGVDREQLNSLAQYHGMEQGATQLFPNINYLTYSGDVDQRYQDFSGGALLYGANGMDLLKLPGAASPETMNSVAQVMTNIGQGDAKKGYANEDTGAMIRAAYVITRPDFVDEAAPALSQKGISGVEYAISKKVDVDGFREQRRAQEESVELLNWLANNQQALGVTGFTESLLSVGINVKGQGMQLANLFGFGGADDSAEFLTGGQTDEDFDKAEAMAVAAEVLGKSTVELLSEKDALQITLAAKLARAVDPSGRLSNQDFEIQLRRIGQEGLLTTMEGVLAKINVVKQEMQGRLDAGEMMAGILEKEQITSSDRRFIRANDMVQRALKHRKTMRRTTTTQQQAATPAPAAVEPEGIQTITMEEMNQNWLNIGSPELSKRLGLEEGMSLFVSKTDASTYAIAPVDEDQKLIGDGTPYTMSMETN